jgi:hypothetical protein
MQTHKADEIDAEVAQAALVSQVVAANAQRQCRRIQDGIARKLRAGAHMSKGYKFNWENNTVQPT